MELIELRGISAGGVSTIAFVQTIKGERVRVDRKI